MRAIEIRLAVIPRAQGGCNRNGGKIVADEIHRLRPRPRPAQLQATREPAIHLYLHRVVIRAAGELVVLNGRPITRIRNEENIRQRPASRRILARGQKPFPIGQSVQIALLQQVTPESPDVGYIEHRLEAKLSLDGEAVVVDSRYPAD